MGNLGAETKKAFTETAAHAFTHSTLPSPTPEPTQTLHPDSVDMHVHTQTESVLCRCSNKRRLMNYASASAIYGKGAAQSICGCYTAYCYIVTLLNRHELNTVI